jgi:quinoprotein glucose dehydrogenase
MAGLSRRKALTLPIFAYLGSLLPLRARAAAQSPPDTDWLNYAGDKANTRYAPLDEIKADNFKDLQIAWRFATSPFGAEPEYILQATPLVAKGKMYFTAGARRDVVSIDAATGEVLWVFRLDEGERGKKAIARRGGRGLSYWTDGTEERILYVTLGYQLVAIDAKTGLRIPDFGQNGMVDLRQNDDQEMDPITADVGYNAAPLIGNGVIVIGAATSDDTLPGAHKDVKGYVRGYDVRTGARLWIFHTIPRKGEFGYDTWLDGTENVGNTGDWAQISIDEELNTVYLGVELPSSNYAGQRRRGNGLFGESIVALDLRTGVRKWHFQTIHHGLWDYDISCAAILCDFPVKGKMVKALAQPTKQSFLYVLNRETGEPIWPIVERKVPKGDVPGEWYSPTQPIPTKPPPLDRQGFTAADVIDFTPELHEEALRLIKNYVTGPVYTPPTLFMRDGTWGTLTSHRTGGCAWPGGAYDPETFTAFIYTKNETDLATIQPNTDKAKSDFDWIMVNGAPKGEPPVVRDGFKPGQLTVQGLPLPKPPYGRITAVDLTQGEFKWQVAHGETPDAIRNHPALKGLAIPRTGQAGVIGPLVTKTLVICGDPVMTTAPSGKRGAMLRAYDKTTGQEVGAVSMPAAQIGAPMTYRLGGSQYIVVPTGGSGGGGEFIAFKAPAA